MSINVVIHTYDTELSRSGNVTGYHYDSSGTSIKTINIPSGTIKKTYQCNYGDVLYSLKYSHVGYTIDHWYGEISTGSSARSTVYLPTEGIVNIDITSDMKALELWPEVNANTYTVTASASGSGGSVKPTSTTVEYKKTATFTANVDSGYVVDCWYFNNAPKTSAGTSSTYTTPEITENSTVKVVFAKTQLKYYFYDNGQEVKSGDGYLGETINFSKYKISKDNTVTQRTGYKMSFYDYQGGSKIGESDISGGQIITSYTLSGWNNGFGNFFEADGIETIKPLSGNREFYAQWTESSTSTNNKLQSILDSPSRLGYTFNFWKWNGEQLSKGQEITEDGNQNAYGDWTPRIYNVSFALGSSDTTIGKLPEPTWGTGSKPSTQTKTFGTAIGKPEVIPERFGYTFVGWHIDKNVSPTDSSIITGTTIDDRFFTSNSTTTVTLYTIWKPKELTGRKNYYYNGVSYTEDFSYTIESVNSRGERIYDVGLPDKGSTDGEWVFAGWVKDKPSSWTDKKGRYRNLIEVGSEPKLPYEIKVITITDWDSKDTEQFYGIWSSSGKYVKINGEWVQVPVAYVNVNGEWKLMYDSDGCSFYVNVNGNWKPEAGGN